MLWPGVLTPVWPLCITYNRTALLLEPNMISWLFCYLKLLFFSLQIMCGCFLFYCIKRILLIRLLNDRNMGRTFRCLVSEHTFCSNIFRELLRLRLCYWILIVGRHHYLVDGAHTRLIHSSNLRATTGKQELISNIVLLFGKLIDSCVIPNEHFSTTHWNRPKFLHN